MMSNQQSAISNQQSAISNQQSAISNQQSAISNQQSAISNQQSAISNQQSSHLSREYLLKYGVGTVFIETGTYLGHTVQLVSELNLYQAIHSIELNVELAHRAKSLFSENPHIKIWQGDSIDCLKHILAETTGPATFWLDAHASGPLHGGKSGGCPLLDELDIIASHSCKEHTIFIDDCRLFGSAEWDYVAKEAVIARLAKINANYKLYYLDGHMPNDVMCVSVR